MPTPTVVELLLTIEVTPLPTLVSKTNIMSPTDRLPGDSNVNLSARSVRCVKD